LNQRVKFKKAGGMKRFLFFLLVAVAILGVLGTCYFYGKYRAIKTNPDSEVQKETQALVSALGKLMELPRDETPAIAVISDKEKLKDQPFFKNAENGDRLFAYNTAMIAILYRPRTNKIINVAPITINQPQNPAPETTSVTPAPTPLRVAYYNGSATAGLSGLTEKAVREQYPNYQTSELTNASRKDYKETLVIDLLGNHRQEADNLAFLVNGKIGTLPPGETAPDADILIISGK
jgi:hypothetical protein